MSDKLNFYLQYKLKFYTTLNLNQGFSIHLNYIYISTLKCLHHFIKYCTYKLQKKYYNRSTNCQTIF